MNSKQRAILRSKASSLSVIFQIGKDGISQNLVDAVISALSARELIKLSVLKTCELTAKEVLSELANLTSAIPVASIGNKIILYKFSDTVKNHVLEEVK